MKKSHVWIFAALLYSTIGGAYLIQYDRETLQAAASARQEAMELNFETVKIQQQIKNTVYAGVQDKLVQNGFSKSSASFAALVCGITGSGLAIEAKRGNN